MSITTRGWGGSRNTPSTRGWGGGRRRRAAFYKCAIIVASLEIAPEIVETRAGLTTAAIEASLELAPEVVDTDLEPSPEIAETVSLVPRIVDSEGDC